MPRISIIIPHLNDEANLEACLASLDAQSADMGAAEIIVVDNGSRALPEAVIARHPRARLTEETVPGPGPARNRGVALASGAILAFTDSDCIADPGWVAAILARFEAGPETQVIGGDIRITVRRPGRPSMAEAFEILYGFRQRMQIARHHFSATANLAMRREVFAAVGPFGGIELSEDLDWGQRAAQAGFVTVFAEEVVVHHPARTSMEALHRQWSRHVSHFYARARARRFGRLLWAGTIPLMVVSPLAEIPAILATDRVSSLRERGLIFAGLVHIRLFRAWRMATAMFGEAGRRGNTLWNRG